MACCRVDFTLVVNDAHISSLTNLSCFLLNKTGCPLLTYMPLELMISHTIRIGVYVMHSSSIFLDELIGSKRRQGT